MELNCVRDVDVPFCYAPKGGIRTRVFPINIGLDGSSADIIRENDGGVVLGARSEELYDCVVAGRCNPDKCKVLIGGSVELCRE